MPPPDAGREGSPPAVLALDTPVIALSGIGPVRAERLRSAGFGTVGDLLRHLPLRYEDHRQQSSIAGLSAPGPCTVCGRLRDLRLLRARRGLSLVRGRLDDGSGELPVVWFNQPYLSRRVDPGSEYRLHGSIRGGPGGWELVNPSLEPAGAARQAVVPVYPPIGDLGPAAVRRLLAEAVRRSGLPSALAEPLPASLLERHGLPPIGVALLALHAPGAEADLEALGRRRSPAQLRLIYGELLELQLELALWRRREAAQAKGHRYRLDADVRRRLRALLPFRLTAAQRRVAKEIAADLIQPQPMLRLLQGDVGSGKTAVAALALALALESGLQAAVMAPTEVLAEQHLHTLKHLLGARYRLELLTASAPDPAGARRRLARGESQLAIGTHAMIEEKVRFRRLGLAIVDEQHRFGVAQRSLLQGKGDRPDLLVMTATPIPRSLALTVYGDLDLSVLDELPPGRHPIATEVVSARARPRVYRWLRDRLLAGEQAYIVFPLVDGSDRVHAGAIADLGEKVRGFLAGVPCAVVHGRTPPALREESMRAFVAGDLKALIATTVIEVGLDVPAATAMVIESAERFGLAQLHQLRGRIGRGTRPATCVAVHGRAGEEARRRLALFASIQDGFSLAEADLAMRGPGELLGTRQSGLLRLRAARLGADHDWLERARADAREMVATAQGREAAERMAGQAPWREGLRGG